MIAYPLAYTIAFKAGRWKNAVAVRGGRAVLHDLPDPHHRLGDDPLRRKPGDEVLQAIGLAPSGHILATAGAVIAGLTYNFLPFMILPLYASLERIDARLIEAAKDLYGSATQSFLRVTLPLSAPGIVAGTLLTFIPAAGDYINAQFLGGAGDRMIGNVIQSLYLSQADYPSAAALSFVLMALIMIVVVIYIRFAGYEALMGEEAKMGRGRAGDGCASTQSTSSARWS